MITKHDKRCGTCGYYDSMVLSCPHWCRSEGTFISQSAIHWISRVGCGSWTGRQ